MSHSATVNLSDLVSNLDTAVHRMSAGDMTNSSPQKYLISNEDGPMWNGTGSVGGATLLFKDVCVRINQKVILRNVFGSASGGELLALMGPSGAGKSTLLNALTGRIRINSGIISLDGEPMTRQLRRRVSYVIQQDAFYPNLTLRETLKFTSHLRLPDSMPDDAKDRKVQEIVNLLELNKCLETRVGDFSKTGLSGGERKRANVACEMLADQDLLALDLIGHYFSHTLTLMASLIPDFKYNLCKILKKGEEPTSGLDASIALRLISNLARYTHEKGKTVVASIHQPSNIVFSLFTSVLLLNEGEVVYFGKRERIQDYYAKFGSYFDPGDNPADFIIANLRRVVEHSMFEDSSSSARKEFESSVVLNEMLHCKLPDRCVAEKQPKWPTSFFKQYRVLTRRSFVRQKDRYFSPLNINALVIGMICGLEFFQLERTESYARDRTGILFFMLVMQGFIPIMEILHSVLDQDGVFIRERSAGIYSLSAYLLSTMTAELPSTIVYSSLFTIIVYWMSGLMPAAFNFLVFWLAMLLSSFAAQSLGIFLSVLVTNKAFISSTANSVLVLSIIVGGFYNPHTEEWFRWTKYFSYLGYAYAGLANIEFDYGDDFRCSSPNMTSFPAYCNETGRTVPGKEFLKFLNLDFAPLSVLILVLISISVVLRLATYAVLRFFRHPNSL